MIKKNSLILIGVSLWAFSLLSFAQSVYPSKAVRLIVPVAPGGATDFTARLFGQKLGESLGQSVIVDNRPGAAGNIGVEIAAKAAPDGYTLVMPITSFSINPSIYSKLPFDTVKDFAGVILATSAPLLLVVSPKVPAKTVNDLVKLAKSKPKELSFANSGHGTTAHLAGELFKKSANVDMVSVPYKGGGPAVIDLVAGRVEIYFPTLPPVSSHIASGRLRVLAVSTKTRFAQLPDISTISESGLPGFDISAWFGIFAPAKTPRSIINQLNKEFTSILTNQEIKQQLSSQGLNPGGGTPEALDKFLQNEIYRWGKLIREIGLKPE